MRKFEGTKKVLSVLLCAVMVLGYLPTPTAAAENGLCAHHETHDEECGYVEAVEGQDCNHQCNNNCGEKNVCTHNCETGGCTLVPAVEKVDCDHQCDGTNCAWRAAVPEVKCTCGAQPAHTAECASLTAEGADCDCGMPTTHASECAPQSAVDEVKCDHNCANGGCSYVAPVEAHYDCKHMHDDSCVEKFCKHVCPEDNCGYVAAAGSDCSYVCEECNTEQEPTVSTITAWSWNDENDILSKDGTYATLPHAADWETLKSVLPAYITAMVDGEEVEIPVQWECETFPAEGEGQGTYELKAILPEGYALGEDVAALKLEVDLGVAEQLDDPTVDTSWHNTTDNSFTLTTVAQLAGLAQLVNDGTDSFSGDTISLGGNLDLSGYTNWTPIGKNSIYSFKGTFDGAGKTIANLTIDSAQQYVGMFGYVNGGTIKNVILERPTVTTSNTSPSTSVGALVGYHSGTGNIEYCGVRNGSVSAPNSTCANTYSGLGGVVGCHNTSGNVIGCYNYMTAVSTNGNTMTRCGGVAGSVKNMAKSCYTYNTNQKGIPVAGGKASGSGTTAQYSAYLKADGTASSSISWNSYSVALSEEEFANGTAAYYLRTGAYSEFETASHSPWGQDVEGDTTDPMPVWNGTAVHQMQWVQNVNGTGTVITDYVNELETKEIDGVTYRVIHDAYDWVLFANLVNSNNGNSYPNRGWNAIVEPAGATIDFSVLGTLAYHNGSWQKVVTIGTSSNANAYYNGTFNGNGCTITGLNYESAYNYGAYALFGYTGTEACVSNITVKNARLTSTSNHYLSTFIRENKGTLENCHAVNVTVSSSKSFAGGMAYYNLGMIKKCSFSGSVTSGGNAGGIAGSASSGAQFLECWNSGAVSGKTTSDSYGNYAGGILAQEANGVTINNCYNTGNITGYYAGGIVGSRYSNYTTTITNCHSYGATLTGTTTYPIANESMTNCYYLADSETDKVNGTTFKTAAEFKDGTVLDLLNGGNTVTVWYQYVDYPILEQKEVPHQHVWNYELNETHDMITATCSSTDGKTCAYSGQTLSMTISANDSEYTGEAYAAALDGNLATALGLTSANIQYEYKASADGTYAAAANTKDAGYYKASITAGEGDGAKTAYVEFAISKVEITGDMVTLSEDTFVYDGETKTVTVTVKVNADTVLTKNTDYTVSGTTTASTLSTGNGYAVTVKGTGSYTGEVTKYWTITKAMPTITAPPTIGTITYGQTLENAALSGGVASVEGTFAFKDTTIAPTVADSNSTEYTLVFTPKDGENYDPVETKVTVTVNPKEIGITWGTTEFTYDGNAKLPTASVAEGSAINGDQLGLTVELVETTEGAGTNAGNYTAKVTVITGDKAGNYKLPADVTTTFSIQNAAQSKPTGVAGVSETSKDQGDGKITGVDSTMEYRAEGETTYIAITGEEVTGLAAGKYYVRKAAKTNYDASEDVGITVSEGRMLMVNLPDEQTGYTITASADEVAYGGTVTLTYQLAEGYTEGETFAVTASKGMVTDNEDGTYTISNITEDTTVSVTGVSDITAPTAEIAVTTNKWTEFLNTITFDLFFKQTQTVTITAEDAGSGVDTIEYYLSNAEMSLDQVKAITTWSSYNSSFAIDTENHYVIYAKVTDEDQNILYISSNGIVLDKTQPVITGVTNGATYYTTQKVTATDSAISETSTLQSLTGTNADGTIPGDPAQETKHTIVATDKAGNTTTLEITMKPISSLAAGLPTEDTVKLTDKETIETIKKNVSDVLTNQSANATDAEKDKLEDIIAQCNDLLNQIKKAEDVIALIQALPDASKVEPDDKTAIDAYDAAAAAYNDPNLPASSKRMVGEENKAKLDAVGKALTDYKVIKGNKSSYVKGSNKTLTFTANGYFGKFTGVEVDGKLIDAKYYSAESGSTIITLKSSYLETLKSGKHTIQVNYTDGHTSGEDYFHVTLNNGSPFTGDNMNLMLMGGVAMTSLLCMAMMILFFPRKKGKYQR